MNRKKYLLSVVAVFIFVELFGWLFHDVALKNLYMATQQFWRPMDQIKPLLPLIHVGNLVLSLLFCYIYTKGAEGKDSAVAEGFRYGGLIGLLLYLPLTLIDYVYLPYPRELHIAWLAGGVVEMILAGIIVALIYRKTA